LSLLGFTLQTNSTTIGQIGQPLTGQNLFYLLLLTFTVSLSAVVILVAVAFWWMKTNIKTLYNLQVTQLSAAQWAREHPSVVKPAGGDDKPAGSDDKKLLMAPILKTLFMTLAWFQPFM